MCGLTFLPHRTSSSPPPCCILIYAPPPSECSPNSRDPLFVSSQHPRGLLGSGLSTFHASIPLSLDAVFLQACSGDSVNTACPLPASATFSLTLTVHDQGSRMHGWRARTNMYISRELHDEEPLTQRGFMYTQLKSFRVRQWCAPFRKCLKSLEESESFLADAVSAR